MIRPLLSRPFWCDNCEALHERLLAAEASLDEVRREREKERGVIYTFISHDENDCCGCLNAVYDHEMRDLRVFCNECGLLKWSIKDEFHDATTPASVCAKCEWHKGWPAGVCICECHGWMPKAFYEFMLELEKLPGSEQQTKCVTLIGKLRERACAEAAARLAGAQG